MTQQDLLSVWAEEAKEALGAKKSGIILDLWKVVAERKVLYLAVNVSLVMNHIISLIGCYLNLTNQETIFESLRYVTSINFLTHISDVSA